MTRGQFLAALPELVEKVCSHLERDDHQRLLRKLKDWTLEPGKTIFAEDISEVLYNSKKRAVTARGETVRLRDALKDYYKTAGANDAVWVGVEPLHYKL